MEEIKDNMQTLENEKHSIAVLVELVLYKKIATTKPNESELREKMINDFIQENKNIVKNMNSTQLREHIDFVLRRTQKNVEDLER